MQQSGPYFITRFHCAGSVSEPTANRSAADSVIRFRPHAVEPNLSLASLPKWVPQLMRDVPVLISALAVCAQHSPGAVDKPVPQRSVQ